MKTVKFLSTAAGSYGVAHTGDELTLKDSIANELERNGTVKVVGDAGEDAEESKAKGSLRIHDETSKEKVNLLEEKEDPKDPTNEAKNRKEKNEKAGPNAPKKK